MIATNTATIWLQRWLQLRVWSGICICTCVCTYVNLCMCMWMWMWKCKCMCTSCICMTLTVLGPRGSSLWRRCQLLVRPRQTEGDVINFVRLEYGYMLHYSYLTPLSKQKVKVLHKGCVGCWTTHNTRQLYYCTTILYYHTAILYYHTTLLDDTQRIV